MPFSEFLTEFNDQIQGHLRSFGAFSIICGGCKMLFFKLIFFNYVPNQVNHVEVEN